MGDKGSWENIENIEKYLRKIDYIIRLKGREILNDFNMTAPQFTALQILINDGKLTTGELSKSMSLACSTITDLIDRMEKSNLVIRRKDELDKRIVRIEVLPKGCSIVEKVLERRIKFLESKIFKLSDEKRLSLEEVLKSLYDVMDEYK